MFPEGLCRSLAVLHKGAPSHRYPYTKVQKGRHFWTSIVDPIINCSE